jgi:serine protease Do
MGWFAPKAFNGRAGMSVMTIFGLSVSLLASTLCTPACTRISSRETPVVRVVRDYAPSVVNIRTENVIDLREYPEWGQYGEELDSFFRQYFGENYSEGTLKYKSLGSGVILDKSGLIVTNAHVIQKASSIYVVLKDGTILKAKVVGLSQNDDLAMIKAALPYGVSEVRFADIRNLMIGETVIAIGNPLGLENSVTVGVLSGKDRAFSSQQCRYVCSGLLQTDASINPGNSGGALLNLDGELIGVNLAVVQNAQNIGFAIPVDKIVRLLREFK